MINVHYMEYYKDILCISHEDLTRNDAKDGEPSDAIMSESNYKKLTSGEGRERMNVVRPGKGFGNYALVELASIPERFMVKINRKYPNKGVNLILRKWFDEHYYPDDAARSWFSTFRYEDGKRGKEIPPEKQVEWTVNASVLNAVIALFNDKKMMCRAMQGRRVNWDEMAEAVDFYREKYGHTLLSSPARFKEKVNAYKAEGYAALVDKRQVNQSARKVNVRIERLLLSIAALPTNPFNNTVNELYSQFIEGVIDICDPITGELFQPEDFYKKGKPVYLSDSTIWNYMNKTKNKILLEKMRMSWTDFNHKVRPHHDRHNGEFSFSKISLDDRDLPRKATNGVRPKAYYAYDVTSGCVIGYAYNRLKNTTLFMDCIRNMFRTIERNGWNVPAQVEVENHLVNQFADGLMRAGAVFPFVRWCNPTNSQEKRAEHFNRAKKYSVEKKNHAGIGRWYLKLSVNRPIEEKIFDEENNNYREKLYDYDELVADDIADINEYNNMLHPNQALYPGMTRWQVLCEKMNPDLMPINKALLYRYIGECTETSIHRNQYCQVLNTKFWLSSPEMIDALQPNDYKVKAYYLPEEDGSIQEVYIYQNDCYIDTCKDMGAYNEATCEQTDEDREIFTNQSKFMSQFDKMVKDGKIQKVVIIPKEEKAAIAATVPKEVLLPPDKESEKEEEDYSRYMNTEYVRSMARAAF